MNKLKKYSQVLVLSLLTILLIIAPLLSSSLRTTYIYFITNLLILVLGAEAGLLSFFLAKPSLDHKKPSNGSFSLPSHDQEPTKPGQIEQATQSSPRVVDKCLSEKVVGRVKVETVVKKCPSMPSLFFIGGGDNEGDDVDHEDLHEDGDEVEEEEEEKEEIGEISGQELFAKAENFIGNFYKQLKMQREDSWKRIHGFYQRALI